MREILSIFQDVEDPRSGNARRHDLHEALTIALLSMLTGGRTCVDMEDFGCVWEPWLREFMTLPNGIPSHDTFSRLFRMLDPAGLQKGAAAPGAGLGGPSRRRGGGGRQGAARSFEDASERSPTHLLQAFASQAKLTLAQVEMDGKSNEIPALPELLELVDVKGRTVTADAMRAQRGTAAAIVAKGGDYALALKRNQGTLREDVATYLDSPPESAELLSHQQVGKGHGRVETRTATVCHDVDWLLERHDWPRLQSADSRPSARWLRSGVSRMARRASTPATTCSAHSRMPSASDGSSDPTGRSRTPMLRIGRLHWVLDVSMDEDRARNRKGNGAACLAVVRRLALNIARMHPDKRSIRRKFLHAQRKQEFLIDMIRRIRRAE